MDEAHRLMQGRVSSGLSIDRDPMEAWRSTLTADIARLQRQLDAMQDMMVQHVASVGRQLAGHHERIRVQEMAADRDPDHAKRVNDAKADRAADLIPVTGQPKPKPVIKIDNERQARSYLAEAKARRARTADDHPDAKVLDSNIAKIEAAFPPLKPAGDIVEAAKTYLPASRPGSPSAAGQRPADDNPRGKLSSEELKAAGEGKGRTEERREEPAGNFLDEKGRRYPVRVEKDGKWAFDRDLLLAAARDARKHKPPEPDIAAKADEIREREFAGDKKDDKPKPTSPVKRRHRWL